MNFVANIFSQNLRLVDLVLGEGLPTGHPTNVRARAGRGKAAQSQRRESHRCKPILLGTRPYTPENERLEVKNHRKNHLPNLNFFRVYTFQMQFLALQTV